MKGRFTIWAFVGAVMVIPIAVFLVVNWYEKNYQPLPVLGPENHRIESFALHDQHGQLVTHKNFQNKIVVADFFFTHCPSICPKMTKNLQKVQQAFGNNESILFTSFSIDPERDSVGRMAEFASRFNIDGDWHLLTGDKKVIYRLARNSFMVDATEGDGGPGDFIHSDKLVLIDRSGRIRGFYKGTKEAEVEQLIMDIERLLEGH